MRLTRSLFALALLAGVLPSGAHAQGAPPPPPPPRFVPPPPAVPPPRPLPAPYQRPVPAPGMPPPYYHPYHPPHFWAGWGWGWGWYPLYGGYAVYGAPSAPPPPGAYAVPPREEERIYSRFSLYGAGQSDGYVGGISFALDGRYVGFNIDANAIARESVTGPLHASGTDPAGWGTAHLTWSFISERSVRLRAETGISWLALPATPFTVGQPWRGNTSVGPDVGISGQLGLVGPIGIEGHARLTPLPVRVADTLIAATIHGGPVGISAGWRWIDVAGDGKDAPKLFFRGPQVGLSVAF